MTLREAVTNVIRHANAHACAIKLALEQGAARLIVSDDGHGRSFREGFGLSGMSRVLKSKAGLDLTVSIRPRTSVVRSQL